MRIRFRSRQAFLVVGALFTFLLFQNCAPSFKADSGGQDSASQAGSSNDNSSPGAGTQPGPSPSPSPAQIPITGAPQILYTDLASGPNSGGENNKGTYLSLFGKNFGSTGLGSSVKVFINDVEVDNYRYLGVSKGRSDIQQITVQVGALGNPPMGQPLPIKVVVNGVVSNTDQTFIVNPGKIYFVSPTGNDSTGAANDITKPFKTVQQSSLTSGLWGKISPGDIIVFRAGTHVGQGKENYFIRFITSTSSGYKSGSAPKGVAGAGPLTIMGYPNEDAFINGTSTNNPMGTLSGINGQTFPEAGKWVVIADLRVEGGGYDGPISHEVMGDNWRIVNNELTAFTGVTSGSSPSRMAGITGNGLNAKWFGNNIHDIQGSDQECHGIYIDGDGSYDIAYNNIHDIKSGNGFQIYVNGGNGSDYGNNISFHHNWVKTVSKHGINIADGSRSGIKVFNNVVISPKSYCLRFNSVDLMGAQVFNNTFYNCNTQGRSDYGAVLNDWQDLTSSNVTIKNNIFWTKTGDYLRGQAFGAGILSNNLWFGVGPKPNEDAAGISADPLFVAPGSDFHLQKNSPAVGSGSSSVSATVKDDYELNYRGSVFDLGALKY